MGSGRSVDADAKGAEEAEDDVSVLAAAPAGVPNADDAAAVGVLTGEGAEGPTEPGVCTPAGPVLPVDGPGVEAAGVDADDPKENPVLAAGVPVVAEAGAVLEASRSSSSSPDVLASAPMPPPKPKPRPVAAALPSSDLVDVPPKWNPAGAGAPAAVVASPPEDEDEDVPPKLNPPPVDDAGGFASPAGAGAPKPKAPLAAFGAASLEVDDDDDEDDPPPNEKDVAAGAGAEVVAAAAAGAGAEEPKEKAVEPPPPVGLDGAGAGLEEDAPVPPPKLKPPPEAAGAAAGVAPNENPPDGAGVLLKAKPPPVDPVEGAPVEGAPNVNPMALIDLDSEE